MKSGVFTVALLVLAAFPANAVLRGAPVQPATQLVAAASDGEPKKKDAAKKEEKGKKEEGKKKEPCAAGGPLEKKLEKIAKENPVDTDKLMKVHDKLAECDDKKDAKAAKKA